MSLKISINNSKVHLGVLSLFLVLALSGFSQDGKKLFKANCAACHKIDKKLVGPALAGVEERWENHDNLVAWIANSGGYLKDIPGDSYAKDLFKKFKIKRYCCRANIMSHVPVLEKLKKEHVVQPNAFEN